MTSSGGSRWFLTLAVMSATLIQVLDTTIVNVALPHMRASFGPIDQISWVLTSYIVASAVVMPITGYLTDRLGRRRPADQHRRFCHRVDVVRHRDVLAEIVPFRLLQGVFGAVLVPLSQAIMVDTIRRTSGARRSPSGAWASWSAYPGPTSAAGSPSRELALEVLHQSTGRRAVVVARGAMCPSRR